MNWYRTTPVISDDPEKNNFHFIRFVAASLVVVGHSYSLLNKPDLIDHYSRGLFPSGQIGVYAFFIISGYLVTQSLLRSRSYQSFTRNRFLRIFPGLAVVLLITVFVIGALDTQLSFYEYFTNRATYQYFDNIKLFLQTTPGLPGVFTSNLHQGANGTLWTLAYEVMCYVASGSSPPIRLTSTSVLDLSIIWFVVDFSQVVGRRHGQRAYHSPD